jgi:mannan endo-1,6-alpha-mannosidase
MCGLKWANNSGQWDGTTGVGQQMAAMEVVLATMIYEAKPPVTNITGGTSAGNPGVGGSDDGRIDPVGWHYGPINSGDRTGAAFVTFVILAALLAAIIFMIADEMRTTEENWDDFRSTMSSISGIAGNADAAVVVVARENSRRESRSLSLTSEEKGKGVACEASLGLASSEYSPVGIGLAINTSDYSPATLPPRVPPKRKPLSSSSTAGWLPLVASGGAAAFHRPYSHQRNVSELSIRYVQD